MKAKKNPTLFGENLGISAETAKALADAMERMALNAVDWLKMMEETTEYLKQKMKKEADVMDKVMKGEILSEEEEKIYTSIVVRQVYYKARKRTERLYTIPIQDIYGVKGDLFICEFKGNFYWLDCEYYTNLADITEWKQINKEVFDVLIENADMTADHQRRTLADCYRPEKVSVSDELIDLNEEDLKQITKVLKVPDFDFSKIKYLTS